MGIFHGCRRPMHREAQAKGRGGIFASYRLRVTRDYTMSDRAQVPGDSVAVHG